VAIDPRVPQKRTFIAASCEGRAIMRSNARTARQERRRSR
jgi:hypothetical protein